MVDPALPPISAAASLPLAPGVYRFRDQAGRVLYIGRAVSLRRRVLSYWGDLGDRGHLAPMVARIARVEAVICDSAHEAAWLERNLARSIAAVLSRDQAAVASVRAELAARRDAAAAALAFEFAGKLQAELEALDWITGEQKVTGAPGIRPTPTCTAGRTACWSASRSAATGWRHRPCGAAAARRHPAKTPPGWADFARRNAELAARLRTPAPEELRVS